MFFADISADFDILNNNTNWGLSLISSSYHPIYILLRPIDRNHHILICVGMVINAIVEELADISISTFLVENATSFPIAIITVSFVRKTSANTAQLIKHILRIFMMMKVPEKLIANISTIDYGLVHHRTALCTLLGVSVPWGSWYGLFSKAVLGTWKIVDFNCFLCLN